MKKLLMIAATTAALSSTAFADAENMFYLKANAGANWMHKVTTHGIKAKAKVAPIFMLGAGYYIMDNVRADLSLEFLANPQLKGSGTFNDFEYENVVFKGIKANVKHKANIAALMVNAYVDMFDVSVAGIFAGVGVGAARVKEKISVSTTLPHGAPFSQSYSTKNKTNLAYQLTVGAAAELAPGVKAELAYSWRDYGKTGKYKGDTDKAKTHYRGHHAIAGVRFDL